MSFWNGEVLDVIFFKWRPIFKYENLHQSKCCILTWKLDNMPVKCSFMIRFLTHVVIAMPYTDLHFHSLKCCNSLGQSNREWLWLFWFCSGGFIQEQASHIFDLHMRFNDQKISSAAGLLRTGCPAYRLTRT